MKRICIIASAPRGIVSFWKTNIEKLSTKFDIYVVANFDKADVFDGLKIVSAKSIPIERRPNIKKDIKALIKLKHYFKEERFDAFISMSSKASLLAAIAGKFAGIPIRMLIFTGQIWANLSGGKKFFFKTIDRLTVCLNTHLLVDGKSQQEFLVANKILKEGQSTVLANGSICGVDVDKFKPVDSVRESERKKLNLDENNIVYCFMGRVNRDKGTFELLEAFNRLVVSRANAKLVLIGNTEGVSNESMSKYDNIVIDKNLILYGYSSKPYEALQCADVFCLPSYREGFGMSAIEAASVGLPVICSDAYGLRDSFIENETGLMCKKMDVDSLYQCMCKFYDDNEFRRQCGIKGQNRVVELFSRELVSNAWLQYFTDIVK